MRLTNLHCEHLPEPLGVGVCQPRLSWAIDSEARNTRQVAYRLQVGRSADFAEAGDELVWESGRVVSDAQHEVIYAGAPLSIRSQYYWRVRVWTDDGEDSGWSEPTVFETGFFSITDWDSQWFAYAWNLVDHHQRTVNHVRTEFDLATNKSVARARLYVAATAGAYFDETMRMNRYVVHLNGRRVGQDLMNPGQLAERRGRALYRTYDVTEGLRAGTNALGLVFLSSKISAQLLVEYADGSTSTINTDMSWRWTTKGPFTTLWRGDVDEDGGKCEIYDARNEYTGWDLPGYTQEWRPCRLSSPAEILAPQLQSVQAMERMCPVSITKTDAGHYLVDFGAVFHGVETIRTKGPVGTEVTLTFSEAVWENGKINLNSTLSWRNTAHSAQFDRYIKKSDEVEVHTPSFTMHSFRYIEVMGYVGELTADDLWAHFAYNPVTNGSRFTSSDVRASWLQEISVRTMLSSFVSVPLDGPTRERQGWLGDAGVCLSRAECVNFDLRLFYEKWFNDISDMQEENGYLPFICPFRTYGLYGTDIPWSTGFVIALWEAYQAYGDKTFLSRYYGVARKWAQYLQSLPLQNGLSQGHAVWNDHLAEVYIDLDYLENVYVYHSFHLVTRIAAELGQNEDAAQFGALARQRRVAINRRYLCEEGVYVNDKSIQSTNTLALYYGIVPDEKADSVYARLLADLRQKKYFATGILSGFCLPMLLAERGDNALVRQTLHWEAPRTWGHWHKRGLTSVHENWVQKPEELGTLDHPALIGGMAAWFYRELAGLQPLLPGYKHARIKPYVPEDITQAEASIQTGYGPLRSTWRREAAELILCVEIPANATAEVHVPCAQVEKVREGDVAATQAVGVRFLRIEDAHVVFAVGSGSYAFHAPLTTC